MQHGIIIPYLDYRSSLLYYRSRPVRSRSMRTLEESEVRELRELRARGHAAKLLALRFRVTPSAVHKLCRGITRRGWGGPILPSMRGARLSWSRPSERGAHGRALSPDSVEEIRRLRETQRLPYRALAEAYRVSIDTIARVVTQATYRSQPPAPSPCTPAGRRQRAAG